MVERFYHGGPRGLDKDGWILPPSRTGVRPAIDFHPDADQHTHVRRDRVFVTTDITVAEIFARMHPSGRGAIYEVVPYEVESDPDYADPDVSFQASKAMIRKVARRVTFSRELAAALAHPTQEGGEGR